MNLDWAGVLAQLGEYPAVPQLPAVIKCPHCHKLQLYIYADAGPCGPWATCASCNLYGDMIEFAGLCWKLDPPAAMVELTKRHIALPNRLITVNGQRDASAAWERRKRVRTLLAVGRQSLLDGEHPTAMQTLATLTGTGSLDRGHRERLAALMFTATRQQLVRGIGLPCIARCPRLLTAADGWQDVLAIPHHDLPNRVIGLTLFSESQDGRMLHGYLPIEQSNAGLANLFVWHDQQSSQLADTLLVTADARLYTQLQVRHLQSNQRRLPLVLAANTPQVKTIAIGKNMQPRPITVIGRKDEAPELLRLARLCDGRVALHGLPTQAPHNAWHTVLQIIKSAVPWRQMLGYKLLHLDPTAAASLMQHIELVGNDLNAFVRDAAPAVRERLERLQLVSEDHGAVELNGKAVRFDQYGWYCGNTTICDADIRLQRRVLTRDGKNYYSGIVVRGDKSWAFNVRITQRLYNTLFTLIAAEMAAHGEIFNFRRDWQRYGLQLAMLMHPPQDFEGIDQVGWDERAGVLRLPQCTIGLGGKVSLGEPTAFPARYPTPGTTLAPPGLQTGSDFLEVAKQSAKNAIWATMAAVLQNVAAPILNMQPEGIVLTGKGAQYIGNQLVTALGCPHWQLSGDEKMTVERMMRTFDQHRWPIYLDASALVTAHRPVFFNWLDVPGDKNIVVTANRVTAYALATRGWQVVNYDSTCSASPESLAAAGRIMVGYLHDLCRRNGRVRVPATSTSETVLLDLAAWVREAYGSAIPLRSIRARMAYSRHVPSWYGFLAIVRHGEKRAKPSRIIHIITEHPHAIWVDFKELTKVLDWDNAPQLDFTAVTQALRETGALISERSPDGSRGWMLNRGWWENHYNRSRATRVAHYQLPIAT